MPMQKYHVVNSNNDVRVAIADNPVAATYVANQWRAAGYDIDVKCVYMDTNTFESGSYLTNL